MLEYQNVNSLNAYEEFVALVINYPELLDKTIIKSEYLPNSVKTLYEILQEEYKASKCFIINNLIQYKGFDSTQYFTLMSSNIARASKEVRFKELERYILESYKKSCFEYLIKNYNGDYKQFYDNLTKVNELSYNENDYIKAKDMYRLLSQKQIQIALGYSFLDSSLNLSQHDLLIVAGSTGGGKTSFALNLLSNLSQEYQCIYFNLEMSKNVLYKRLLAIKTKLTMQELKDITILPAEKKEIVKESMLEIEKNKIILVNKSVTTEEIKQDILNINTDKHIIVFVDHIGLIRGTGKSLYEKMTNIAKDLRAISLNYNCTIIGLCQLSRESQRRDEEPRLQDLRDSGEIEQSARKVLLLYDTTKNKQEREHEINIIIAKNDDGNKITKEFRFDRFTQEFKEVYFERRK